MRTVDKIALAKVAYWSVRAGRRILGRSNRTIVERAGLTFELDLSQGIDFSIFLLGGFELSTRRALERCIRPGMTVLDVGANVGAHTLSMARMVGATGKVLAFEPTGYCYKKLRRNIELNPLLENSIECFQYFLTTDPALGKPDAIYSSWPLTGGVDLHEKHFGQKMDASEAMAASLDSVLAGAQIGKVDVVKMDVDGFECDVLGGAAVMMERDRPVFVMELAPYAHGESFDTFIGYFNALGYQFYDERTDRLLPRAAGDLRRLIGDAAGINVVARV